MKPILSMPTVLSAPDGYTTGTAITTTDSVVTQTASGDHYVNWNFLDSGSTSYSKVLVIAYGMADYFGIAASETEFTGASAGAYFIDSYLFFTHTGHLMSGAGGSWSLFHTDTTMPLNDNLVSNPIFGLGLYLEGTNNVQKTFFKSGTSNWAQTLSTTDSAVGSNGFKSMGFYGYLGALKRIVAPVMAWGVV